MKKSDEMERYQVSWSEKISLLFYIFTLLIWSIYSYVTEEELGFQFVILCVGLVIFFFTLFINKKKAEK